MFGDSFFKKVEQKTNVSKDSILNLANKLQNGNKSMTNFRNISTKFEPCASMVFVRGSLHQGMLFGFNAD